MAVGRALRATACPNCRISMIRSFASLAGPAARPLPPARRPYAASLPRLRFSSTVPLGGPGNGITRELRDQPTESEEIKDAEELPGKEAESADVAALPWYLQAEGPQRAPQPLSERQRIPELPESPPTILQPMLQRLSVDLGLDDLSLLDLRKLDPPPALGTNLMMVIGTARSEKHLHVSADRFCRWLRSTYGLRPDADGLLGRNELKLKLRRKARRAKLLGSAMDENEDDGVRSGWICVDVGVVESGDPSLEEPSSEDFVGFGRRTDGVTIVVQMMTEEKREEIDLERLWSGILKRSLQQQNSGTEAADNTQADAQIPSPPSTPNGNSEQASLQQASHVTGSLSGSGSSPVFSQRRGFHSSAFRQFPAAEAVQPINFSEIPSSDVPGQMIATASMSNISSIDDVRASLRQSFEAGKYTIKKEFFLALEKDIPELQNRKWREILLQEMHTHVKSIPEELALEKLRFPKKGSGTQSFIQGFFYPLPRFSSEEEVKICIEHLCWGIRFNSHYYTTSTLIKAFKQAQMMAVPIAPETFLQSVRCVMTTTEAGEDRIKDFFELVQVMHDQGHDVLTAEVYTIVQEGLAGETPPAYAEKEYYGLSSKLMSPRQERIHAAMMSQDMPLAKDEVRMQLMDVYADQGLWGPFWDAWSMAPRRGSPQGLRMYAYMFQRMAQVELQRVSMAVLRTHLPEMDIEYPDAHLRGELAEAVRALLRQADPHAEAVAAKDPTAAGEWVDIWRRIEKGAKE